MNMRQESTAKRGNRLRVGVRAKNARLSGLCVGPSKGGFAGRAAKYFLGAPNSHKDAQHESQARKRNPNPNFLVRTSSSGVGFFHVKGWGPKSSVCPSKPWETKLFGGISPDFCRDIPGAPEKFEKKSLCSISAPRVITLKRLRQSNPPFKKLTGMKNCIRGSCREAR